MRMQAQMHMQVLVHDQPSVRLGGRDHRDERAAGNNPRTEARTHQETAMQRIPDDGPVAELGPVQWQKSRRSNSQGNCVELARLSGGQVAVRNSRHPEGLALVYTHDEMVAFIEGAKDGDFDHLVR